MPLPREVWLGYAEGVSSSERGAMEAGLESVFAAVATKPEIRRLEGVELWQQRSLRFESQPEPLRRWLPFSTFAVEARSGLMGFALQQGRTLSRCSAAVILVVDVDLQMPQGWLFGATEAIDNSVQSVQLSVLSVARSRQLGTKPLRSSFLSRLARHEYGHAIGLVPESRKSNVVNKIGLHCTNVCSMRQGMSLPEFASLAREEDSRGIVFCAECLTGIEIDARPKVQNDSRDVLRLAEGAT